MTICYESIPNQRVPELVTIQKTHDQAFSECKLV